MSGALRQARLAEAAHFEAVLDIRDAQTLRLQVLKDELAPMILANTEAASFIDLALVPGDPPRLWIDLITAIVMAPDPRTYRLVQDGPGGRQTLLETANRGEVVERVKQHIAHRLIAREREKTSLAAAKPKLVGYSTGALVLAWLSGFSIGVLALFAAGILISRLGG
ncbi:MAG: hypothetical protein AB7F74_17775 [Parvibaculaceae bacterium]